LEEKIKEKLEEFLHNRKISKELRRLAAEGKKSLVVNFDDLLEHDMELSRYLCDNPEDFLQTADEILYGITKIPGFHFRVANLGETTKIREVRAEQVGKFIQVEGVLTRASDVKPEVREAVFKCLRCGEETAVPQTEESFREPLACENPNCGRRGPFKLVVERSEFRDWQSLRVQERPEELRGGQMPRFLDCIVRDDFVDRAVPGNRVVISGILRVFQERAGGKQRKTTFRKVLFVNYIDVLRKGVEEEELKPEDEERIKELAKDKWIRNKIISSIAPSIYGYEPIKEAIALQLFGCPAVELPDGTRIRGDTHILLSGDPGCLVADERIVLGNGEIVKIGDLGSEHLQPLRQQVLTGQGSQRDIATRFHIYRDQPILEIVTETGKSVKGTFNHPLLVIEKQSPQVQRWKRMDEIQPGDRVATVSWIPCSITKPVKTGWRIPNAGCDTRAKCKLPAQVDAEVAAVLGYVLGKGWVRGDYIGFNIACGEEDLLPLLSSIFERKFGLFLEIRRTGKKSSPLEAEVHNAYVATNLQFLRERRVPALIMKSGNEVVAEFLAWLFEANGGVLSKGRGRGAIRLRAEDIELLRDVQMLLLRFGIHSRIVGNYLVIQRARSILGFSKNIGFRSKKKREKLAKIVANCRKLNRCRGEQLSERVVSVRFAGRADVYDIEVPKSHRFIANGVVSHNTAKSQILKWVAQVAPRGLYTSGKKATGPGLTASAVRDDLGGGWTLEAGALAIADGGLACIDEFDKISPEDSGAILESMEQQTVSVAKAGIVATLNTRTAILAAANPHLGRFDEYRRLTEQIDIPPVILSRFDLIFIMRDEPREEKDRKIAHHMLELHRKPEQVVKPPFDVETLRKIIIYARKHVNPRFKSKKPMKALEDFFVQWRRVAEHGALPITARQLEGLVRLTKANARMRLSDTVTVEDANRAIKLVKLSLQQAGIDPETGQVDIDVIMTGRSKSQREKFEKVLEIIRELEEDYGGAAPVDEVKRIAGSEGISERFVENMIEREKERGHLYEPRQGVIKRAVG